MCGIFACKPFVVDWLENSIIQHQERGPDQNAIHTFKDIGVSVNRLAITGNLEQGSQPVFSSSQLTFCVFNGAIYNTEELITRFSLKVKSKNEAAVLLELYELKGESFINYIRGMFSIILVDKRDGSLLVTRDILGIKPLYWVNMEDMVIFSSSLNAIPEPLLSYATAFPPGEVWINNTFREKINPEIFEFNSIENLLLDTVTSHIPKEVNWGCSLSGGVDSSLLCALAKSKGHSFNCYTIDTGGGLDLEAAKEVSSYLDLPLKLVKVTDLDIEKAFPKIVKSLGTFQSELILGGLFTYFISRKAYGDGLKVLLFGEGADEVFGGYNKYQSALEESFENANKMMLSDLNTLWLTHNRRVDHASMAASIEARVPYQDVYVTNNARKLPMPMKIDKGNLLKDKIVLRDIAKKYLPNNIALREKEVISRGTDLGFMLNKVSRKMASYYRVESISNSDRKDFHIESYIEAVAFKIWKKMFPNLAENVLNMKQRGLIKKISV